jgi:hypothetical protein
MGPKGSVIGSWGEIKLSKVTNKKLKEHLDECLPK